MGKGSKDTSSVTVYYMRVHGYQASCAKVFDQTIPMSTVSRAYRPGGPHFTGDGKRARITIANSSRAEVICAWVAGGRGHMLGYTSY